MKEILEGPLNILQKLPSLLSYFQMGIENKEKKNTTSFLITFAIIFHLMAVFLYLIKFVKILLPFKVSYNCLQIVYGRVHWLNPKFCYSHVKSKYNLVMRVKVASENRQWTPFSQFLPPAAPLNTPPPTQ